MEGNNDELGKLKVAMESGKAQTPKLEDGVEKMAELSKDMSVDSVGNTSVVGAATVKIGQTWEAAVTPRGEVEVNLADFKTAGIAKAGGSVEKPTWTHFEPADAQPAATKADTVSDSVRIKKEPKPRKAKVKAAETTTSTVSNDTEKSEDEVLADAWTKTLSEPEKKSESKLSKAGQKEVEARTHSDSMLGPVIPAADADNRSREEKLTSDAWEKEVGGSKKSERSKELEEPKSPEQIEYDQAVAEWQRTRNYFNGEVKDSKLVGGIEHQFQEKYEDFLKNQGAWKLINGPRKFFGMDPILPKDLRDMEAASKVARAQYFESAKKLKEAKEKLPIKGIESEERASRKDKQGHSPFERYQAMLARKLVIGVGNERKAIQEKLAIESGKNSWIKPTLEAIHRHRQLRWGAMAVGYGVIGGAAATGGVLATAGAAGIGGAAYLARMFVGMKAGAIVGTGMRAAGERNLGQLRGQLDSAKIHAQSNLFDKGFTASEAEIIKLTRQIKETEASTKIASVGTAAIAGLAAGNLTGNIIDAMKGPVSPEWAGPPYSARDPYSPEWQGPPEVKGAGSQFSEIPEPELEGVPPDLQSGPKSSLKEMGDLRVMEEMQNLAGTPKPLQEMGDLSVMEEMQGLSDNKGSIKFTQIPDPQVEGVPPGLKGGASQFTAIPEPKLEGVPPGLKGAASHFTEIPNPQLKGVPPDLEVVPRIGAPEVAPETPSVPEATPETSTPVDPEVLPETPDVIHKVVKGDNVWNIMEGKGPDANPVGGKSEVLKGMSLTDRQEALDKLVDYAEKNPEFAKEVGALKSGGNIHRIYPGEDINVSILDDKLRELLNIEVPQTETAPEVVEPDEEGMVEETKVPGAGGSVDMAATEPAEVSTENYEDEPHEPEDVATNINELTLGEVVSLYDGVQRNDPNTLDYLRTLDPDMDAATFKERFGSLAERIPNEKPDLGTTVQEYLKKPETALDIKPTPRVPEVIPYDLRVDGDTSGRIREASAVETTGRSIASYVRGVEQPRNGVIESLFGMGKANVAGTFEQMKDLRVGEVKAMVANSDLPEGVTEAGFDRWVDEMNKITAADNERFADVIARAANSRVA